MAKHLDPPHFHTKGSYGNVAHRAYAHAHAQTLGRHYVPRPAAAAAYSPVASMSFPGASGSGQPFLNQPTSRTPSAPLPHSLNHSSNGLSMSPGVSSQLPPASQSMCVPACARPRQGRYSVTNLDFKDFQAANDVASFLRFLRLHKYIETVERQGITLMQLLSFSDQELQNIGFRTIGARTRLVKGIERFHEYNAQRWYSSEGNNSNGASNSQAKNNSGNSSSSSSATARPSSVPLGPASSSSLPKTPLQELNNATSDGKRSARNSLTDFGVRATSLPSTTINSRYGPANESSNWSPASIDVDSFFGKSVSTTSDARPHSAAEEPIEEDAGVSLADGLLRFLWMDDARSPTTTAPAPDFDAISHDGSISGGGGGSTLLTKVISETAPANMARSDAITVSRQRSDRLETPSLSVDEGHHLLSPSVDPHFSSLPPMMPRSYDLWGPGSNGTSPSLDVSVV